MSRLERARPAVRPALFARALLSGPPGSGKTRSALIVAEALAGEDGKVLVVDTEKESALTYADDFTFDHLPWQPPFDPRDLASTVTEADGYAVVVVDSMSHFWRGDGGILDIAGGKYTGWKDARPAQVDLVEAILGIKAHVVLCARSKVEHVQEQEGGKWVVRKVGMAVVQDDDLEYELNVAVELDMDHSMTVSKSRTVAVPVGRTFKAGHAEDFAVAYREWLEGGEPLADGAAVKALMGRMNALGEDARKAVKQEFLARFGRPEHLRASQAAEADAFVADFEAGAAERIDEQEREDEDRRADAAEPADGDGGEG